MAQTRFGFGERGQFYCEIEFAPDPDDAMAEPEEAASWGTLQIWVGGKNLTAHYEGTQVVESVSWHLLPVLEWLAAQWDHLFHEQRLPVRNAGDCAWASLRTTNHPDAFDRAGGWDEQAEQLNAEWVDRHCLWSCRNGGLLPDLVIRRLLSDVEVSWSDSVPSGAPDNYRFMNGLGSTRLDPLAVAQPLFSLLDQSSKELLAVCGETNRLSALRRRVTALEQKKQNARMAILAGLGNQANAWVKRWERLQGRLRKTPGEFADWFGGANEGGLLISGNCEGALMFGAAEPTLSANDVLNLATRLVSHSQGEARADCLLGHTSFSHPIPGIESNWSEGYQLARAWSELSELKPNDEGFVDVESHLRDRGVEVGDIELQDEAIGGVAVARPDRGALVLVNTRNPRNNFPSGRRFTLAHELCHLLHDRSDGQALALISGPWAPRDLERRANAFAAMLLMPDALVEDAFSSTEGKINNPDWQQLVAVAQQIQVSPDALAHHMSNRGWITTGQRRILLEQSGDE